MQAIDTTTSTGGTIELDESIAFIETNVESSAASNDTPRARRESGTLTFTDNIPGIPVELQSGVSYYQDPLYQLNDITNLNPSVPRSLRESQ